MSLSSTQITLVSIEQRPDLWSQLKDKGHPLVKIVDQPIGSLGGDTFNKYYQELGDNPEFCKYLFAAVHVEPQSNHEEIVACAKAVPFHWPGIFARQQNQDLFSPSILQGLPDGGFSTIISIAIMQCLSRRVLAGTAESSTVDGCSPGTLDQEKHWETAQCTLPPNCLSALEVTVLPEWRRTDLAVRLIRSMRDAARASEFQLLVVPLRPTRKYEFPLVSMNEYITWRSIDKPDLPHDPWLRKHVREGGKVIKVAPVSEILEGNASQWAEVTGINMEEEASKLSGCEEAVVDVIFPGCFNPLRWNVTQRWGRYEEPNVWLYHVT
jgi:hypothetical protein